jgi:predicted amidohydrolase
VTIVAACQLALAVGSLDDNAAAADHSVAEAAGHGAQLVVLPELSDTGYVFTGPAEARALAAPASGSPALERWRKLGAQHNVVIAGGFGELGGDGRLYNSAALVDGSGPRAVYRKAHLWDAEKLVFTPGETAPPVVDLGFGRVALMICYDLEFPEWVRLAALHGADLIAAPVNWPATAPAPAGERPAEIIRAQADAAVNGVFVAVADRCGAERGVDWVGGSVILGPDGYPLAGPAEPGKPAVLLADCDLPRARDKTISVRNDLMADRRPDLYRALSAEVR